MFNIEIPLVYTFEAIASELAIQFKEFKNANFKKPELKDLFQSLSDKEFLKKWLVENLDNNFDEIIDQFSDATDFEDENKCINEYLNLLSELRIKTGLYDMRFIADENREQYVREKHAENLQSNGSQNFIDWKQMVINEFIDYEEIYVEYPLVGFYGWIYCQK